MCMHTPIVYNIVPMVLNQWNKQPIYKLLPHIYHLPFITTTTTPYT